MLCLTYTRLTPPAHCVSSLLYSRERPGFPLVGNSRSEMLGTREVSNVRVLFDDGVHLYTQLGDSLYYNILLVGIFLACEHLCSARF